MNNRLYFLLVVYFLIGNSLNINAQSLLDKLEQEYPDNAQYEHATFKSTHISIGHSVENRKKGVLQMMLINSSWNIPNSKNQSFVADKWSTRVGVEYGITDRLTTGVGWATLEDVFDGYLKYNLVRQIKNSKTSPLSITLFQNTSYRNENGVLENIRFIDRLNFTSQVLIARKFNTDFSLQISPTFIHTNSGADEDPNNHFALGFGGRYKVGGHVSLVSEYYYVVNPLKSKKTYGAFALGVNWDVRYLLLQFRLSNARSMVEDGFILNTQNNFNTQDGNLVFGFNAVFSFFLKQKKI
tara:strand:- start:116 stop:1006 length:891 start_codon:yes stop_codon:yes gene_type:complete